jgi:phosphoglycerol transferase MdoB-like AlkP superfamily enzyme
MRSPFVYALVVVLIAMGVRHWKRFSRKSKFGTVVFLLIFIIQEVLKYLVYTYPLNTTMSGLASDFFTWVGPALLALGILLMFVPPKKDKKNNS